MVEKNYRIIAFYLPQFHPIAENNEWWEEGFTEWTNVSRAKPLFRGHYQPRLPADLGFYDLRVPETRAAQAKLARRYGLEGFCYWHYWFAGKRLIERPFNEVLGSGQPDFPFCLAWANQSWTGVWHGTPDKMLMAQTYPGAKDDKAHFYAIVDAFRDERYMTIEGKPIFIVHSPAEIPEPKRFTDCWRELALEQGLPGLYFIGIAMPTWNPRHHGFDASILSNPGVIFEAMRTRLLRRMYNKLIRHIFTRPIVYSYKDIIRYAVPALATDFKQYPCVMPNWDNTPRCGMNGIVLDRSTPELFSLQLKMAFEQIRDQEIDQRIIFIKSWNEWAEGNYLEPDRRFGKAYLKVIKNMVGLG
ncbi:MAG: lipopolysaccharide biosynthesis protein [Aestuariibacter sp.]|nr:lipopolysaccharide biosynthesis protein [Aestuariibacter sp.]